MKFLSRRRGRGPSWSMAAVIAAAGWTHALRRHPPHARASPTQSRGRTRANGWHRAHSATRSARNG